MRVLVTGADGFVGQHVVKLLQAAGEQVVCGCRSRSSQTRLATIENVTAYEWVEFDLVDPAAVHRAVRESAPDAVVHLAGVSSVSESWQNPTAAFATNVLGAYHLLQSLAALSPAASRRRIVLVGSAEQYGQPTTARRPLTEVDPQAPNNPYGATKAAQEMIGCFFSSQKTLSVAQTRSFLHVGPGQRPPYVIADWASQLIRIAEGETKQKLRVGNLSVIRDITDVRDVARAYILLLRSECEGVFNVCSGRAYVLREVLELLCQTVGIAIDVEIDQTRLRAADIAYSVGDPSRLMNAINWRPEFDLRESLRDLVENLRWSMRGSTEPQPQAGPDFAGSPIHSTELIH